MKIELGDFFTDNATGAQRAMHVTLTEEDIFPYVPELALETLSHMDKARKMTELADLLLLDYAVQRGYRAEEVVLPQMQRLAKSLREHLK